MMWVGMYVKITEDAVGRMHWHKVEYTQLEGNGSSDGGVALREHRWLQE